MKKKKTVYDLFQEGKELTKKSEDAYRAVDDIIVERNKKIEDFTKKLDEEIAFERTENNRLGNEYWRKSGKVLAKVYKLKIPWEKAIEYIIDALKDFEGKTYELVANDDEWYKFEGNRYEIIHVAYLKREDVKVLVRETAIKNTLKLYNILEKTDGYIVLNVQSCCYFGGEKVKFVLPENLIFGKSMDIKEASFNEILTGRHEYLIEEVAKKIEIK